MSAKKPATKPVATLADLTPDPQNARKHNPRNIGQVQNSLQKYGAARSIVIDENNQIIAGHGVVEAAGLAGIERVQVVEADGETIIAVRRSGLTKKQKIELGIADNRGAELAEWDTDVLKGWAGSDIDLEQFWNKAEWEQLVPPTAGNDAADPGAQVDKAAELQAKWGTALGQLWQIGRHRLLVGDCTVAENVARLMGDTPADLLLTDPPYSSGGFQEAGRSSGSIGTDAKVKRTILNDTLSTRGYQALIGKVLDVCGAGMIYVFTDWRMWVNLFDVSESKGFGVRNMIVWDKGSPGMGVGWRTQHELVLFATKTKLQFDNHKAVGNVIQCQRTGNEWHATEKPVELIAVILGLTDWASVIYDSFCGSGTTLVACEKLGRSGRGMELSPAYAAVTLERLSGLGLTPELLP